MKLQRVFIIIFFVGLCLIVFDKIKKIDNLKYQEITIFLWKKVMVINNNNYQIFNTK